MLVRSPQKCNYLLIWCGEKGRDIANTWSDVTDFERFANNVARLKKIAAIQAEPRDGAAKKQTRTRDPRETAQGFISASVYSIQDT